MDLDGYIDEEGPIFAEEYLPALRLALPESVGCSVPECAYEVYFSDTFKIGTRAEWDWQLPRKKELKTKNLMLQLPYHLSISPPDWVLEELLLPDLETSNEYSSDSELDLERDVEVLESQSTSHLEALHSPTVSPVPTYFEPVEISESLLNGCPAGGSPVPRLTRVNETSCDLLPPLVLSVGGFKCDYPGCKASAFQTQYLLSSHRNVHCQGQVHYCPVKDCPRSIWGKGFRRKNEMIRHGLVHNSPGYLCPFCPDRDHKFPRPDNLQRHVRVHHIDKKMDEPTLHEIFLGRCNSRVARHTTLKAKGSNWRQSPEANPSNSIRKGDFIDDAGLRSKIVPWLQSSGGLPYESPQPSLSNSMQYERQIAPESIKVSVEDPYDMRWKLLKYCEAQRTDHSVLNLPNINDEGTVQDIQGRKYHEIEGYVITVDFIQEVLQHDVVNKSQSVCDSGYGSVQTSTSISTPNALEAIRDADSQPEKISTIGSTSVRSNTGLPCRLRKANSDLLPDFSLMRHDMEDDYNGPTYTLLQSPPEARVAIAQTTKLASPRCSAGLCNNPKVGNTATGDFRAPREPEDQHAFQTKFSESTINQSVGANHGTRTSTDWSDMADLDGRIEMRSLCSPSESCYSAISGASWSIMRNESDRTRGASCPPFRPQQGAIGRPMCSPSTTPTGIRTDDVTSPESYTSDDALAISDVSGTDGDTLEATLLGLSFRIGLMFRKVSSPIVFESGTESTSDSTERQPPDCRRSERSMNLPSVDYWHKDMGHVVERARSEPLGVRQTVDHSSSPFQCTVVKCGGGQPEDNSNYGGSTGTLRGSGSQTGNWPTSRKRASERNEDERSPLDRRGPHKRRKQEGNPTDQDGIGDFPCIFHIGEPERYPNHTKRYRYISLLLYVCAPLSMVILKLTTGRRHLQSNHHAWRVCGRCYTVMETAESWEQHFDDQYDVCFKSCTAKACRRKRTALQFANDGNCKCITTAGEQWRALFKVCYPNKALPDTLDLRGRETSVRFDNPDSGLQSSNRTAPSASNFPLPSTETPSSGWTSSLPQLTPSSSNNQSYGSQHLTQTLSDLRKSTTFLEQHLTQSDAKYQDLQNHVKEIEDLFGVVWEAFQATNNPQSRHGSWLQRAVAAKVPRIFESFLLSGERPGKVPLENEHGVSLTRGETAEVSTTSWTYEEKDAKDGGREIDSVDESFFTEMFPFDFESGFADVFIAQEGGEMSIHDSM